MAYKKGQWYAVCDVCGFKFLSGQLRERWDGLMVDDACFETQHPQEFIRSVPESLPPWTNREGEGINVSQNEYWDYGYVENEDPTTNLPAEYVSRVASPTPVTVESSITWNPTIKGAGVTLSGGNKTAVWGDSTGDWAVGTTSKNTGKWYFEVLINQVAAGGFTYVGIVRETQGVENTGVAGSPIDLLQRSSGLWSIGGGVDGIAFIPGDVIGIVWDFSTRIMYGYKNGVANGNSAAFAHGGFPFRIGAVVTGNHPTSMTLRTTTAEFTYDPPLGAQPWGSTTS